MICKNLVILALSLALGTITACRQSNNEANSEGITQRTIKIGSVLALEGQEEALGNGMKAGLEAALNGEVVQGKRIELIFENDFYDPPVSEVRTKKLVEDGVFLMIGNVGTPTAKKTLPILLEHKIPAVGFFTGADLLRSPPYSEVAINYRASYVQEIATVVEWALAAGVQVNQICAYVQNDSYGRAGLEGLKQALLDEGVTKEKLTHFNERESSANSDSNIQSNDLRPVGFYTRNTPDVIQGYNSLKQWEEKTGTSCKLVVTAGTYSNIARFAKHAKDSGEDWVISSLSFTGAEQLELDLEEYGVTDKVIMTQVVPFSKDNLPIVKEFKKLCKNPQDNLSKNCGYVALEGYIVGKMLVEILKKMQVEINRDSFIKQVSDSNFDFDGVTIDFTQNSKQASDFVEVTSLNDGKFTPIKQNKFAAMLK
ncbi:MAG: ABC transporter substrate-binding protein [Symploca sp. SIO2C1]|nr:ABC transporter substrate-binding protein [Symploca sp. SIO2C1]